MSSAIWVIDEFRQAFNGVIYYKRVDGCYAKTYKNANKKGTFFLHRVIWEAHNGPIPEGYDIHHIDRDKANNNIDNLKMLPHNEHARIHAQSDMDNRVLEGLSTWENREPQPYICEVCGKVFYSRCMFKPRRCGNACNKRWQRLMRKQREAEA